MPRRLRWVLTGLIACAAAAILAVALANRGNDGAAAKSDTGFAGAQRPPGVPPKDFSLRDQDGKTASLAAYRGKVVVLTFMYSTCKDTCPLQADQIRGALDDLGGDAPPALTVSVDPVNDTPDRAKRFLFQHALTGRMRFLLGSRARLAPLWKAYGIQPQGAAFDHSAYVLLIDKQGRQRIGFPLNQLTPEGLAHDVRLLEAQPS
jgi:protein SCO1/2